MSVIDVFCPRCAAVRPHAANEALMSCTGCGQIRHGLGEGLAVAALTVAELPVDDMRFCIHCNETKAVGHACPGVAFADPYGSPSDIDTP